MLHTLALLAWAVACGPNPHPGGPARTVEARPSAPAYASVLAQADERVQQQLERVRAQPNDWMRVEMAASAHLQRARLVSDYADYAAAEALLDQAFAQVPEGAGPFLTRAKLNYSLHRLDRVGPDLDAASRRLLLNQKDQSAIAALRGELAMQLGDYDAARAELDRALQLHRDPHTLATRATLLARLGEPDQARALYEESLRLLLADEAMPRAWTHLQLAELDLEAGRAQAALEQLDRAEQAMPGWWQVESHRAAALLALGRPEEALTTLRAAAALEPDPETLGKLANLLDDLGQSAEAASVRSRALSGFEALIAQYPEAAAGHAIRFFLDTDPARALALAQQNAALRPNGEAKVLLARALLANDRGDEARILLGEVLASPWRSAELTALSAELPSAGAPPT